MPGISAEVLEAGWSERNAYWAREIQQNARPRRKRERPSEPLILCGHGVSLRVDGGTLLVRNGRTHFPHEPELHRFFRGDLALPPRIIMLDGSGSVSFDVLAWLAEQGVPLIQINWRGEVVTVAGGNGYAAKRENLLWQLDTKADPQRRLTFATSIVRQKIEASLATLDGRIPARTARDDALTTARLALLQLDRNPPADIVALRAIEAASASAYFRAWRGIEIDIRATARRPVPDAWRRFEARSSLANGRKLKNCNASNPLNAMLNYAYALLQAQLHIKSVMDGFDPTIGIMHHERREGPTYIFDLMEPERPKVDAAVLAFVAERTFNAADFTLRSDGVVRLSPQLARSVCLIANGVGYRSTSERRIRNG